MDQPSEQALQADYYSDTADRYDSMHGDEGGEHLFALGVMQGLIGAYGFNSVLDIGSGTGRVPLALQQSAPHVRCVGIEPVSALRDIGHRKGLAADQLIDGNALALDFPDDSFDLVCAYAVLHHIKDHRRAVSEMCRVAKHGIFLSDANNFGQGSRLKRGIKQSLHALGLWPAYDWMATKGKGYHYSVGDGVFYSYSVTSAADVARKKFRNIHTVNTLPAAGFDMYRHAPHMALFCTNRSLAGA